MKILVYGSNGWIGSQFINILIHNKIEYLCGNARCDDEKELEKEIKQINPTNVISFIGRTHGIIGNTKYTTIDYLEQPGKLTENIKDNLYSPLLLSHICNLKDIHYTYLGTGCIFDDEDPPSRLFKETNNPNFFGSSYSIVKGFTDRLMKLNSKTLNLRIRMPINSQNHHRNFITKIINYDKICSIPNSMTVLPDFYPIILDMIKKNQTGTINLVNPDLISHNEILEMYRDIVDPSFKWTNFTIEDQDKVLKSKRSNNHLDTTKIQQLYPSLQPIKDSIRKCLLQMKNNS